MLLGIFISEVQNLVKLGFKHIFLLVELVMLQKILIIHTESTFGWARSIIKYGYGSFVVAILEFLDNDQSQEELIKREQYYFNLYLPIYNLSITAGAATPPIGGSTLSLEHKTKISNSLKGRPVSEETRLRIASTKIGELNPRWGVVPSEAERAASRVRMLENNPMHGKGFPVFVWSEDKVTLIASYRSLYHASHSVFCLGLLNSRTFKFFSTNTDSIIITPLISYSNAESQKENILKDNKGKSGIYRWVNTLTGDSYVGSSVDLSPRVRKYFNFNYLKNHKNKMIICNALLKYGYSNFSFEIIEYCDKKDVISREQYYLDTLAPKYNILKTAGNLYGHKHSLETKELMSLAKLGKNNPQFGKTGDEHPSYGYTRLVSEITRNKLSEAGGLKIYLYSLDFQLLQTFVSSRKAAEFLGSSNPTIMKYARSGETFKGLYILSLTCLDSK